MFSLFLSKNKNQKALLYFFSFPVFLVFVSCIHRVDFVTIDGRFTNNPESQVFLSKFEGERYIVVDSTVTNSKGDFKFKLDCNSSSILSIGIPKSKALIVLVVEPGQSLTILANKSNLSDYEVRGSEGSILVQKLNTRLNVAKYKIDSLKIVYRSNIDHPMIDSIWCSLDSIFDIILNNHKEFTLGFVKNNPYSLASILALYQSYDSITPILDYSKDKELFGLVDKSLFSVYSSNSVVKNFHSKIAKLDSLYDQHQQRELMFQEGMALPDASYSLISGENLFFSGIWFRYMLIDFWASWIHESNHNNAELRDIQKEYGPKGLVILQVSIDTNLDSLKLLVDRDSLMWYHAYVQNFNDSKLLDTLRITSIPANYLIDRWGNIKAVNLTDGKLRSKLKELLP
ncbi:MAG: thioredoxin-like domain-containing protein [Tenuifilaceae bacterium]